MECVVVEGLAGTLNNLHLVRQALPENMDAKLRSGEIHILVGASADAERDVVEALDNAGIAGIVSEIPQF